MAFNPKDYHPDWKNIRRQILDQAGHKCEFCDVPNGAIITRIRGESKWRHADIGQLHHGELDKGEYSAEIILTIAHLDHVKSNNDPVNLHALCQRCHLLHDIDHHRANAAATRRRKRQDAGQLVFA